jgi:hypothetical protein
MLLNFSHPLSESQLAQIALLAGRPIGEVRTIPSRVDQDASSMHREVDRLLALTGVADDEWKSLDLLVILPSLSIVAVLLAVELQFLCGFGSVGLVRIKTVKTGAVTVYQPAEVLVI